MGTLPSVFIPIGGEATRLLPLTADVSKAGVRFLNRPLIEISTVSFAKQGVRNFILGIKGFINYRSLHDYFGVGMGVSARYKISPRVHLRYAPNVPDVGSADSARISLDYYGIEGNTIVAQCDNIADINLRDFLDFHQKKESVFTIALTQVENVEDFGIANLDEDSRIKQFLEKPSKDEATSDLASTGIYVMSHEMRNIFNDPEVMKMREKGRLDFGKDVIPYLLRNGYPVYGYVMRGLWYDIGSPKAYLRAMKEILDHGQKFLDLGSPIDNRNVWIEGQSPESISKMEVIKTKILNGLVSINDPVLVGRHCSIGDGSNIGSSCIDNFTIIGSDVEIDSSAILDRSIIGDGAKISNSIIGRHVTIKSSKSSPTSITDTTIIGDGCTVGEGCQIQGSQIYPNQRISDNIIVSNEIVQ